VQALGNKYRYRRKKDGQIEDLPEKLHPWSDVADALQYLCLSVSANLTGRVMARNFDRPRRPVPTAAGWT
jgi:hypothetical protein